jgi:two-component system cell cycle sensor histidine kinase/response regulator CckA
VVLEVKHGRDLGAVRADPGQLEQVVVNLAVNARDAMLAKGAGGRVTIQTRAATIAELRHRGTDIMPLGDYTALEIADTGTGIPPEVLPKIFEPFFTTKEVGKGTGLGLSTVYGIVKQSGGFIFADSKPGQGATFTIYFPVHSLSPDAAPSRPVARAKSTDTWGTGTILLVEDEDMVRAIAERALTRQGYTVLAADHGEAALELLENAERPSLIVSDVMMPVMDGPALARRTAAIITRWASPRRRSRARSSHSPRPATTAHHAIPRSMRRRMPHAAAWSKAGACRAASTLLPSPTASRWGTRA